MLFQRILVPYDGSKFSDKAFENAIGIARLSGSNTEVILLHITPNIPVPLTFERPVYSAKTGKSIPLTQYIQELTEEMEENASKMLEDVRKKYTDKEIKIENVLLHGYPPEKIIEFAKNEKVDLIVIGSVGLSGLSKVKALGSVSRNVSERASCPVLIVH
ncbi:MAG TPA: universal stress protein [Nitrososphaeraceae archaeon]|nr:universal stress protein [Nitrososphaeraceae archaeon]